MNVLTAEQKLEIATQLMSRDAHETYTEVCKSLELGNPETIEEWEDVVGALEHGT
jgi:hypothetical protein